MIGESQNPGGENSTKNVLVEYFKDCAVITPRGDMDLYATPEFSQAAYIQIEDDEVKTILVDFSETDYIDSTFLGATVMMVRRIRREERQKAVVMVNMNHIIRKIYEIQGFDKVFNIIDTPKTPEPKPDPLKGMLENAGITDDTSNQPFVRPRSKKHRA